VRVKVGLPLPTDWGTLLHAQSSESVEPRGIAVLRQCVAAATAHLAAGLAAGSCC
jgi:hypothetical protein